MLLLSGEGSKAAQLVNTEARTQIEAPERARALAFHSVTECVVNQKGSEMVMCLLAHVRAGAETGAGGRMRDTHATGIGSIMGAGTAGYCVGNLNIEGTPLPGEDSAFVYPESLAPPLQVRSLLGAHVSDEGSCMCNVLSTSA